MKILLLVSFSILFSLLRLRIENQRLVPLTVLVIPVDEIAANFADITARFVADELGYFGDISVSVFGITLSGFCVPYIEAGINLVANDFREGYDIDVIGRFDV